MTFEDLIALLQKWDTLGRYQRPSGTVRYGGVSEEIGMGALHYVYCPLDQSQIVSFIEENRWLENFRYPSELRNFNGLKLFGRCLSLYGLLVRPVMNSSDMPFDLVTTNAGNIRLAARFNGLIIGGGNFGYRSVYYIQDQSGAVFAVDRSSEALIHRWSDFDTFLNNEIGRLNNLFTEDGKAPVSFEGIGYI